MPLYVTSHPSANTSSLKRCPPHLHGLPAPLTHRLSLRGHCTHAVFSPAMPPSCRCPLHPAWVLVPRSYYTTASSPCPDSLTLLWDTVALPTVCWFASVLPNLMASPRANVSRREEKRKCLL